MKKTFNTILLSHSMAMTLAGCGIEKKLTIPVTLLKVQLVS